MFAVIETGGKQHRVSVGQNMLVERLPGSMHDIVEFSKVLLISHDGGVVTGTPTVAGAKVVATLSRQERGPKLLVFRYKSKKRVRVLNGHRQEYTRVFVRDIVLDGVSLVQQPEPAATPVSAATAPEGEEKPSESTSTEEVPTA